MQVVRSKGNIGVWVVMVSLAAASAFFSGGLASAEDTTAPGNRVVFRGGCG